VSVKSLTGAAPGGARVHSTAVVDPTVRLDAGVRIGPYAVLTGDVDLGAGCVVEGHAVVQGPSAIGAGSRLMPYCVVGTDPQDHKYEGERTLVRIGERCTLREFVTVNRGTGLGGGETSIGDDSYVMAHAHVAHDCRVGSRVVVANACSLAGHVTIGEGVVFGGLAAVGQYVRIGTCAFIAAGAMIERDVPPFAIAAGDRARLAGVNLVGLERRGVTAEARRAIVSSYTLLLRRDRRFLEALAEIERAWSHVDEVRDLLSFVGESRLGIVPPG
jgi:UDP-N-acetylglucosamine acyltransferase